MRIISPGLLLALASVLAVATSVSAEDNKAASLAPNGSIQPAGGQLGGAPLPPPINHRAFQKPELLDNYGLIKGIQNDKVSVRLLNGDIKTYLLASNTVGAKLRRGGLVGFRTNIKGEITRLSPPQVRKVYTGTLIIVDGQKIGMVTPQGDRFITTLAKNKIARMGLAPGQPIKITQYRGTWATKVCQPGALNDDDSFPILAEQGRGTIIPQEQ
ncbi:hypothetical protein C1752_04103 [Acaryochloris thomasi RCC1774]|uniref:DUF5666 domain-containing protein n=1 Tax=Acaryochloris thomasi RCC1774 TaxID=1764569 RepID=A0A2W1JKX9_9CYAN|nr:hypothetical protein [Acaryochloris thomasi]PZD72105.1 hypothetical protein C1752_04103 [Acaryochloris thomasi RCC1774]